MAGIGLVERARARVGTEERVVKAEAGSGAGGRIRAGAERGRR